MNAWLVIIPGIVIPYSTIADNAEEALSAALAFHALPLPPPGTVVEKVEGRAF